MDREKLGRALLEYCGAPMLLFMTAGLLAGYAPMIGIEQGLVDPLSNYLGFYVLNFWLVIGVYSFRQKYRQQRVLEPKKELALAGTVALTWVATQPLFLLVGYMFFFAAALRKDKMETFIHSSLLPEMPEPEEEELV